MAPSCGPVAWVPEQQLVVFWVNDPHTVGGSRQGVQIERGFPPDNSFDCVTACYVVSAAPDPHKVVSEIRRVCKPGGRIVFINHFKSHNIVLAKFEELINGICKHFGWETTLDLDALLRANNLESEMTEKVNMFDYWRAVLCINSKD